MILTPYEEFIKDLMQFGMESIQRFYSVYAAIVADNDDPEQLGRIKISVPEITAGQVIDKWITPVTAFGGNNNGFVAVPSTGENVWVTFRCGDPRFPVYVGSFWAKGQFPEEAKEDYPNTSLFKSKQGHYLKINDTTGEISITQKNGNTVKITEDEVLLSTNNGSTVKVNDSLVELNGNSQSAVLGNTAKTELEKNNARLEGIVSAFNVWIPTTADGIALKAAVTAALAGTLPANYSNILSTKVKLD